jgi:DNA (cytosine-5)-methyltransferase 1
MNGRPRLLDLFCGAGGCSMGYHRAGFDVVGVDIEPHPDYPFEFHEADAMTFPLDGFDVIHASPPCQAFTVAGVINGNSHHQDLLTPTRERLIEHGAPWVIENVPGAPMRKDLVLCGTMFGFRSKHGQLIRHRWFEFGQDFFALVPPCNHQGPTVSVFGHGGHVYHGVDDWREVMGIDWMKRDDLAQAIPPAYTEFVGQQLLTQLEGRVAA